MSKTLVLELPDELGQQLATQATMQDISLEEIVLQHLIRGVSAGPPMEADPITPLLGSLRMGRNDVAEHHDAYLGAALQQELHGGE